MTIQARRTLSWLGCAALLGTALGCSSQSAETKRQFETLNERLLILQNDRDRLVERVDALEAQLGKPSRQSDEPEATAATGGRPPLKIVRLEPTPGSDADAPARQPGADTLGEQGASSNGANSGANPGANPGVGPGANPDEPKVVLYGEGTTSGVRASAEGVNNP